MYDAGAVDQDVRGAEVLGGLGDGTVNLRFGGDVGLHRRTRHGTYVRYDSAIILDTGCLMMSIHHW